MRIALQEWIRDQIVGDEMLWKGSFGSQVGFVRDVLQSLVAAGLHYPECREIAFVISTHRSKSIDLPVYELARPDLGLRLIL